tara:strand:- start:363 stop:563 length:201 start_codon:yes stop_codon:yes gene_type:complete
MPGYPFSFIAGFPCNLLHRYLSPSLGHLVSLGTAFIVASFTFDEILWLIDTINTLKIPIFAINPFV